MRKMSAVEWVALVLVVVGALNWGLVGLFQYNLVEALLGAEGLLTRVVYVLVGLAGVYEVVALVMPKKE